VQCVPLRVIRELHIRLLVEVVAVMMTEMLVVRDEYDLD
jgi:hypothetical protein